MRTCASSVDDVWKYVNLFREGGFTMVRLQRVGRLHHAGTDVCPCAVAAVGRRLHLPKPRHRYETTATQSLSCDKILDSSLMSAAGRLSFLTGTQQMNIIRQDMFRAGVRDIALKDNNFDGKILYYVMSHYPGQATSSWRRLFYGALAHGMKTLDLYEFHSSWHATENYVDVEGGSYENVLAAMHELGQFEDMYAVASSVCTTCLAFSTFFCRA